MLRKDMRKKLQEHTWLEISRRDSNPSDTLRRLTDEANRAISDLILIADRLPNHRQAEIFRYENMKSLLLSMLRGQDYLEFDTSLNDDRNDLGRKAHLSSLLAVMGIRFCKNIFEHYIEKNPALRKATVEKLDDANELCEAIALKTYSQPSSSYRSGLVFLFTWNKITDIKTTTPDKVQGDDNIKLVQYLNEEITEITRISVETRPNSEKEKQRKAFSEIVCYFTSEHRPSERENICDFFIDEIEQTVSVVIYKHYDRSPPKSSKLVPVEPVLEKSLILRKEGKDLRVYRQSKYWEPIPSTSINRYDNTTFSA